MTIQYVILPRWYNLWIYIVALKQWCKMVESRVEAGLLQWWIWFKREGQLLINKAKIARLTVKSELRIFLLGCSSSVISRISNYTCKQHVTPWSIGTCHLQGGCLRSISNNVRSCSHIWRVGAVIGQGHCPQFPHDGGHLCSQTTDITFYSERSSCAI